MSTTGYIILGIVILVSLVAAGFLIWHFAFRKHGNTAGESCTANDQCAAKHYCGGDGMCHQGVSGGASGTDCTSAAQCMFGLRCTASKCSSGSTPPDNNVASFTDSHITMDDNGTTRYLSLVPANTENAGESLWGTDVPSTTFTYSSSTNEMSVSGEESGRLFVNSFGSFQTGTAAKFFFLKQPDGKIRLEDGFTNTLKTVASPTTPFAIFLDPPRYTSQSFNETGTDVFVNIVKA